MASDRPGADARATRASRVGRVLLVEDEADQAAILKACLHQEGLAVEAVATAEEALAAHASAPIDVLVTDVNLPGMSGLDLMRRLAAGTRSVGAPAMPLVVVMTGVGTLATAIEALKLGASDYLQKPIDPARLVFLVRELLRAGGGRDVEADRGADGDKAFEGMFGASRPMQDVFDRIHRVAATMAPVLIVGESGTGKELAARAVHARSRRAAGPFVPVHTGAIPRELIGSELFGHEKGSFTGAFAASEGKFEAASGGTVFLDEVGTMDPAVQVSLLRVLETYRFTRVGGRSELHADVRIVAATNKDLLDLVDEHVFREDLYYRLNVFTITLPPLRDRREDIPPMATRFLARCAERYGTPARGLSLDAEERLLGHDWPGNVRELRNVMEQTALFATTERVAADQLELYPGRLARRGAPRPPAPAIGAPSAAPAEAPASFAAPAAPGAGEVTPPPWAVHEPVVEHVEPSVQRASEAAAVAEHPLVLRVPVGTRLAEVERQLILLTLDAAGGNKQRAARILGISRRGLYSKLQAFGLHVAKEEDPTEDALPAEEVPELPEAPADGAI